jgi:para-aminobenzoate synthetase component I
LRRNKASYQLTPATAGKIKLQMLNWANQFSIVLLLDSNNYTTPYSRYECILATGARKTVGGNEGDLLSAVQSLHDAEHDWLFGHISYDLKNITESKLTSGKRANTGFPLLHFFIPETVCYINKEQTVFTIESFEQPADIYTAITQTATEQELPLPHLRFAHTTPREGYLATIQQLRQHIKDGDCYEINFCTEGYCNSASIEPVNVFKRLNSLSPAPFAAYYRLNGLYMMSASPERYLLKDGAKIISQPMKGTARRGSDTEKDGQIKRELHKNVKERAENVMIVDLVRNDLARSCQAGSIKVEELFGIYTFPQVHQMISTVSGTLRANTPFTDAIRYSFPMGSMTGAPKFKVMQLIEQYERSRRELFSGSVGYISPDGDFDFNVVIRSLFYNAATQYLSYQTGGAITYDSNAEQEWEEMRLKAWALEKVFDPQP